MALALNLVTLPKGVRSGSWSLIDGESGDAFSPIETATLAMFVAVTGTTQTVAGTDPVTTLEGSADGVSWFPIKDVHGNASTVLGTGVVDNSTAALQVRASIAGDGGNDDQKEWDTAAKAQLKQRNGQYIARLSVNTPDLVLEVEQESTGEEPGRHWLRLVGLRRTERNRPRRHAILPRIILESHI